MGWGAWNRKPAETATVSAVGLDVNASRVRAVGGPSHGTAARSLSLEGPSTDLPLLVSFERRTPEAGRAGYHLVRRLPHLVCRDFLPELGREKFWQSGRHRIDAAGAVLASVGQLAKALPARSPLGLIVPGYLSGVQAMLLAEIIEHNGFPVLGHTLTPLALAATDGSAFGTALVLDADERALSWSVVISDCANARLLAQHSLPGAGIRAWFDRLIDAVSDRCIRLCRRDPRDSAVAEQGLFEQLDAALSSLRAGVPVMINVRTAQWFQELRLTPDDLESFGSPLTKAAVDGMRRALAEAHAAVPVMARPDVLWITADAARLPGLVAGVTQHMPEAATVKTLPPEAVAMAGHSLAEHWLRGELPRGRLDTVAPRFAHKAATAPNRLDALRARARTI